jgi:uncharacterized protein YicC (UPF0701 family)
MPRCWRRWTRLFTDLAAMRAEEGRKLEALLVDQIDRIAELTEAARQSPERSAETIRARLVEQIARSSMPARRSTPTGCTRKR